jgi:hypothetical protein
MQGSTYVVGLLLKAKHPDATEDDAFEIVNALDSGLQHVFKRAMGKAVAPPPGETKAPAA